MWYEVIPTAALILVGLGLPSIAIKFACTTMYDTVSKIYYLIFYKLLQ